MTTDGADHWWSEVSDQLNWAEDPKGVAATAGGEWTLQFGTVIMTEDHKSTNKGFRLQKTMTHEIGHLLGAGRADDSSVYVGIPKEVYSGDSEDPTPEQVRLGARDSELWSVMTSGFQSEMEQPPINGEYTPFSIEELFTVEFNDIITQRECVSC